ncbi:hypothetical protein HMPREF3036_02334 [Sutterella sp. KLE1602]|nr:hypothetical protein HMPREF3036_02334 [Sutterella sp. KLE1602]
MTLYVKRGSLGGRLHPAVLKNSGRRLYQKEERLAVKPALFFD